MNANMTWTDALEAGLAEVARVTLNFEYEFGKPSAAPVSGAVAWIQLAGEQQSIQVGVSLSLEDCKRLAKHMFMVDEGDAIPDSDMVDAMGELMNMTAGTAKRLMKSDGDRLLLGLPFFAEQMDARFPTRAEHTAIPIRLGEYKGHILIIQSVPR